MKIITRKKQLPNLVKLPAGTVTVINMHKVFPYTEGLRWSVEISHKGAIGEFFKKKDAVLIARYLETLVAAGTFK